MNTAVSDTRDRMNRSEPCSEPEAPRAGGRAPARGLLYIFASRQRPAPRQSVHTPASLSPPPRLCSRLRCARARSALAASSAVSVVCAGLSIGIAADRGTNSRRTARRRLMYELTHARRMPVLRSSAACSGGSASVSRIGSHSTRACTHDRSTCTSTMCTARPSSRRRSLMTPLASVLSSAAIRQEGAQGSGWLAGTRRTSSPGACEHDKQGVVLSHLRALRRRFEAASRSAFL